MMKLPYWEPKMPTIQTCETCAHRWKRETDEPCQSCLGAEEAEKLQPVANP